MTWLVGGKTYIIYIYYLYFFPGLDMTLPIDAGMQAVNNRSFDRGLR